MSAGEESYTYYGVRAPWLVVKLLRLLQVFPFPGAVQCGKELRREMKSLSIVCNHNRHIIDI